MVDDAHGEGVLGDSGRGIVNHFKLRVMLRSKWEPCPRRLAMGGFVTGPKVLIDYLRQRARPFLFSSGITLLITADAIAAVDVLLESVSRSRDYGQRRVFQKGLKEAGFDMARPRRPLPR